MSEQNKIDEIKEALAAATPGPWSNDDFSDKEFIIYDHTYFNRHIAEIVSDGVESKEREEANAHLIAKAPEYITYLLQEIERLQKEEEFWKEAAENQRENNYELLKKIAVKDEALKWYGDFGNWYVKDGSWPALEDKGERARLAYKGEGDASG